MNLRLNIATFAFALMVGAFGYLSIGNNLGVTPVESVAQLDPMFGVNEGTLVHTAQLDPMFGVKLKGAAAA